MDMIYRSGLNPSVIERMFSKNAEKAERMKVYYQHLNQVRIEIIDSLKATQAQIVSQKESNFRSAKKSSRSTFNAKKTATRITKITTKNVNLR